MKPIYNYWIMQEPRKNAHRQDFNRIARHNDYDEAKRVVLRELGLKKRTYMRAVEVNK